MALSGAQGCNNKADRSLLIFLTIKHLHKTANIPDKSLIIGIITSQEQAFYLNNPSLLRPFPIPLLPYKNKIIKKMQVNGHPNSELLLRQFVSEAQIANPKERTHLKQHFKKKLSQHINMLQFHQLREDRFILSQKKILEKQNHSIEKAKEFLDLRQQKAVSIKNHYFVERSKRAEEQINKWESIVNKNKERSERKLDESKIFVKHWNEKLSQSCTRKSTRLDGISKNLKEKMTEKEKKFHSLRIRLDQTCISNPQYFQERRKGMKKNKKLSYQVQKNTRAPTESFAQRRKKQEEEHMKESIIKTVNKEERINQARYTRHYLQERKKKMNADKQQMKKITREGNLTTMKGIIEEKNQLLQRRYTLQRSPSKQKGQVKKEKEGGSMKAVFNHFQESQRESPSLSPNRNYQRMMTQKLKEISLLMRKKKTQ